MIGTTKDLFARQTQTWANCPDWVQAIILDKICGTIRAKIEKEHGVRQERREGYTDDWAAVAAELQSQASSQTTRRPAHQSQTPRDWVVVAAELPGHHPARRRNGQPTKFKLRAPAALAPQWGSRIVKMIGRTLIWLVISSRPQLPGFSDFSILLRRAQKVHRR